MLRVKSFSVTHFFIEAHTNMHARKHLLLCLSFFGVAVQFFTSSLQGSLFFGPSVFGFRLYSITHVFDYFLFFLLRDDIENNILSKLYGSVTVNLSISSISSHFSRMTHLTNLLRIAIPKTKLKSMHEGGAASSRDPNTNRETGFERDYKCDNWSSLFPLGKSFIYRFRA